MKALIISDNHGDSRILNDIKEQFAQDVDVLIHCGDSELKADSTAMQGFKAVKGNNDWGLNYPGQLEFTIGGLSFLVVHGDHDHVNYSLTPLMLKAQSFGSNIVCYGHTHQLAVSMDDDILFINPGSISLPRGEYSRIGGTFAIVDANEERYMVDYYDRNCQLLPELHFEFERPN